MATYKERLASRKREFGTVCRTLSDAGNGHDTTIPAPLGEGYTRGYWPSVCGYNDFTPLPHEKRVPRALLKRFVY